MCLIAIAWHARPGLPLVVAANRDEWRERPTQPAHWWPDHPTIYAGRDLSAGGTWMGITRGGRFAAVTNFRDPSDKRSTARSRGGLVTDFLLDSRPPREFLAGLAPRSAEYNGFNLLLADRDSLWYYGSREGTAREVPRGIHGLSNHLLDEPWPKVVRIRAAMHDALAHGDPAPRLFDALADRHVARDEDLPSTGVGIDWERRLASALIAGEAYGTRSSSVVSFTGDGEIRIEERTLAADGSVVENRRETVTVERS